MASDKALEEIEAFIEAAAEGKGTEDAAASEDRKLEADGEGRERERDAERNREQRDRRHRERDRGKRRDRDGDRDRVVDRDRDRGRDRGRDRDRDRDRSRDKDRNRDRDRDRERDKERDRGRDRDRDRDRDGDRDRDRDRDRDYRGYRERDRRGRGDYRSSGSYGSSSSRDRPYDRDRHGHSSRGAGGGSGGPPAAAARSSPPPPPAAAQRSPTADADPDAVLEPSDSSDRDARTIFISNVHIEADEKAVFDLFDAVGKVRDVKFITDRNSRRSKGMGYVEFYDVDGAHAALALSGKMFMKKHISVQPSRAEKNRTADDGTIAVSDGPTRLYVGSLHFNMSEDDVREVFETFGTVNQVQLHKDELDRSRGFGFVQFDRPEDAKAALQQLDGVELAGRAIKVGVVNEQPPAQTSRPAMESGGAFLGELDDDEGGGLSLTSQSRAALMAHLQAKNSSGRGGVVRAAPGTSANAVPLMRPPGAPMIPPPLPPPGMPIPVGLPGMPPLPVVPLVPVMPVPPGMHVPLPPAPLPVVGGTLSQCVALKNMFSAEEASPEFFEELREDVQEECEKFGKVLHFGIDEKSSTGVVYLKFDGTIGSSKAIAALNRRWFGGKQISAEFVPLPVYSDKFPSSAAEPASPEKVPAAAGAAPATSSNEKDA